MERIAEASPRSLARMAGVSQLLEAVTATFGQVIVLGRLVVSGNAAATSANILRHERLIWFGFASSLIGVVFHVAWGLLLYDLLKPVHRRLSLFAAFVILVGCAIQAFASLFLPCSVAGFASREFLERVYGGPVAGAGVHVC